MGMGSTKMNVPFFKYQGAGNDFVIIDQFEHQWIKSSDTDLVHSLCDRRFGIGADGLILLESSTEGAFSMIYFNADGNVGSLCGNGGRCAVSCAHHLNRFGQEGDFIAFDGAHKAVMNGPDAVHLKMQDIQTIETTKQFYVLDTGSPHYVTFVEDISDLDIAQSGRAIRYSKRFTDQGINVNFVEENQSGIEVATYERGVEDETLSCGTGVTAAALSHALRHNLSEGTTQVRTKGGDLSVRFKKANSGFSDIWLSGPATLVFEGKFQFSPDDMLLC